MADFLNEKRSELDARLKELRPLHDEYLRLERAIQALDGLDTPRRGPGRPRGSGASSGRSGGSSGGGGVRRRRRGRRGGTRAEQALAVVRESPGITVSQLGDRLGVAQKNYLYRVMNGLEADGAVRKQGRGYTAV